MIDGYEIISVIAIIFFVILPYYISKLTFLKNSIFGAKLIIGWMIAAAINLIIAAFVLIATHSAESAAMGIYMYDLFLLFPLIVITFIFGIYKLFFKGTDSTANMKNYISS